MNESLVELMTVQPDEAADTFFGRAEAYGPNGYLRRSLRGAGAVCGPCHRGRTEMLLASEHFIQPDFVPDREAVLKVWTRCASDRSLTEREAQTALAFLSDGTLMFNSVIPHGLPFQTHRRTRRGRNRHH